MLIFCTQFLPPSRIDNIVNVNFVQIQQYSRLNSSSSWATAEELGFVNKNQINVNLAARIRSHCECLRGLVGNFVVG